MKSHRHTSFNASYHDADAHDTGNGAISYTSTSPTYPGVLCREIEFYATGRGTDHLWYEATDDPAKKQFTTPGAALAHTRSLSALPDATLLAELKRRGIKTS